MRRIASFVAFLSAVVPFVLAQEQAAFVLARRSPDGEVSYKPVYGFMFDNNKKVRLWAGTGDTLNRNTLKQAKSINVNQLGIVRKDEQGRLVELSGAPAQRRFVLPDKLNLKGTAKLAQVSAGISLGFLENRRTKSPAPISQTEFFALIPTSRPEFDAVNFALRDGNFLGPQEQLSAMDGLLRSFPNSPQISALREDLLNRMRDGLSSFEDGGPWQGFLITAEYATLASRGFPQDRRPQSLSKDVLDRKSSTERSVALLTSLANSRSWDAFLENYAAFERFQWSFPDIIKLRTRALQEGARIHAQRGAELASQKRYQEAIAEYDISVRRDPQNQLIAQNRETIMHEFAQSQMEAQRKFRRTLSEGSMDLRLFQRHLDFAEQYIQNRKFDEAISELAKAEELNKEAPEILLVRAEVFYATGELWKSIPLLDDFDRAAVSPELRRRGEDLRNKVLFDKANKKSEYVKQLDSLMKAGKYSEAIDLVRAAVRLDQNDDECNYYAGMILAVLRKNEEAKTALKRYLDLSVSLGSDLKRRDLASRIMSTLEAPSPAKGEGRPNWFSGRILPTGTYYCPESLAFQFRPSEVRGYKMTAAYDWAPEGKLKSIVTQFEDDKGRANFMKMAMTGRKLDLGAANEADRVFFTYHPDSPQVLKVAQTEKKALLSEGTFKVRLEQKGTDDVSLVDGDQAVLVFLESNPSVNADAVRLLSAPAATGVSGNSVFNPFVWDGIHYFRFTYDPLGRVAVAREMGTDNVVRFDWDGVQLQSVNAYRGDSKRAYYTRTMHYDGRRLLMENVSFGGSNYKIEYKYAEGRLERAEFDDKGAHDGREWRVLFR